MGSCKEGAVHCVVSQDAQQPLSQCSRHFLNTQCSWGTVPEPSDDNVGLAPLTHCKLRRKGLAGKERLAEKPVKGRALD